MSQQTERDYGAEIREHLKEWWAYKNSAERLAIIWLTVVAVIMVILTFIFPGVMLIIWIILVGLVVFCGTVAAIAYLVDPF